MLLQIFQTYDFMYQSTKLERSPQKIYRINYETRQYSQTVCLPEISAVGAKVILPNTESKHHNIANNLYY